MVWGLVSSLSEVWKCSTKYIYKKLAMKTEELFAKKDSNKKKQK